MGLSAYNPGKITGGGVAVSKISYIDLSSNAYSETDAQTIGLGNAVVTPVVNDVINLDNPLYTEDDMLKSSTTEAAETEKKSLFEMACAALKATGAIVATGIVTFTSVLFGVVNLGEKALDGVVHVGVLGFSFLGLEDEAQAARDFIARDLSGELNEALYEGIGSGINDASLLKYDSDLAKNISKYSEKAATVAAATALSVASGGIAGPIAVGFLVGSGDAAETNYKNGGTSKWDETQILINGALTSLSWMACAELGNGVISLGKTMGENGIISTFAKVGKDVMNKDFAWNALKSGSKNIMNYANTVFYIADDIGDYFNGEREVNIGNIAETTLSALLYFSLTSFVSGLKGYITEEGKLKIKTSEDAKNIAKDINNGNKSLKDVLDYNKEAQKQILSSMSSKELADAMKNIKNSQVTKIYDLLNTEQQNSLINQIATDISTKQDLTLNDLLEYGNNFTSKIFSNLESNNSDLYHKLSESIGQDVVSGKTNINEVIKLEKKFIDGIKNSLPAEAQGDFVSKINAAKLVSSANDVITSNYQKIGGIIDDDSKLDTIETLGDAIFGDNDIPIDNIGINGGDVNGGGGVPRANAASV